MFKRERVNVNACLVNSLAFLSSACWCCVGHAVLRNNVESRSISHSLGNYSEYFSVTKTWF